MENVVGNAACCFGVLLTMVAIVVLIWAASQCGSGGTYGVESEGIYDHDCGKEVGEW